MWLLVARPWAPRDAPREDTERVASAGDALPIQLPSGDIMDVARSLGARAGYGYIDGDAAVRALVFVVRPGWYTIVYYVEDGDTYTRLPGTYNPTGYDEPRLAGSPPILAFHSQQMGVDFTYRLREGQMTLEALGSFQVGPAAPMADPTLPGLMVSPVTRTDGE